MKTETVIYKEHEKKQNDTVVLEPKETTGLGDRRSLVTLARTSPERWGRKPDYNVLSSTGVVKK